MYKKKLHDPNEDLRNDAWVPEKPQPQNSLFVVEENLYSCKINSDNLEWDTAK